MTNIKRVLIALAVCAGALPLSGLYAESVKITQNYATSFNLMTNAGALAEGMWYLKNPHLEFTYDVTVVDRETGTIIPSGSVVNLGQKLVFRFEPLKDKNTFWFASPGAYVNFVDNTTNDSPYGAWVSGAPRKTAFGSVDSFGSVLTSIYCSGSTGDKGSPASCSSKGTNVYAAMTANPPVRSLNPLSGLTCEPPITNPSGSIVIHCEVTGETIVARFNFDETYARFSGPGTFLYPFEFQTSSVDINDFGWMDCEKTTCNKRMDFGDWIQYGWAASLKKTPTSRTSTQYSQCMTGQGCGSVTVPVNPNEPFRAVIPAISLPFRLTAQANNAPTAPSVDVSENVCVDDPVTITLSGGTDPDNHMIRYGLNFNGGTNVTTWIPETGYITSGGSRTFDKTWITPGVKTIRALTQDEYSKSSSWTEKTITVSDTGPCARSIGVLLTATPQTIDEGDSSTLEWSTTGNPDSCEASASPATNQWNGATNPSANGGTKLVTPDGDTTYTITCTKGTETKIRSVTVTVTPSLCVPDFTCVGGNLRNSCDGSITTCATGCTVVNGAVDVCTLEGTADLSVSPQRVRKGVSTTVIMDLDNAGTCTVTDGRSGGDSWTVESGPGERVERFISKPIMAETTYTMTCTGAPRDTATVTLLPTITEF